MDTWVLWFLLLQSVFQYPQPVGDGLDEASRLRMEAHAKLLEEERIRLEREVEQLSLQQGVWGWGDLLSSALQHWQLWAAAGHLLLLLALGYSWRRRSLRRQEPEEGIDGANEEEGGNAAANVGDVENEEEAAGNDGDGDNDINAEENNHANGNADEVDNAAAANEDGDVGNEEGNEARNEMAERDPDDYMGWRVMQRIQWPEQDLRHGCEWTRLLMFSFAIYFRRLVPGTFYPVLERAIMVGSAFEGWSPREQDAVYQVLIPMTAPPGHSFHLELEPAGQRCTRNFRVRVQQECTCGRQAQQKKKKKKMLCFLHHPEEELRRNQDASLLDTLCTDSYLDVEKTARWFYQLVRAIWPAVLQSHCWHLVLLPSRRSCQFKVTNGTDSYRIEMLFGVRQGHSDIFVSSQPNPAWTSSTTWPESYAAAEVKFFQSIASRAPPGSLHLKCLQFFTSLTLGLGFSSYTIKTIVMHMLSVLPMELWRRRHFVRRLRDISENLRTCVEERRLNHFIVGNRRLPEDISLPPELLTARTCNLFHELAVDPLAHSQALQEYMDLQQRLDAILNIED